MTDKSIVQKKMGSAGSLAGQRSPLTPPPYLAMGTTNDIRGGFLCGCEQWGLFSSCGAQVFIVLTFLVAEHQLWGTQASVAVAPGLYGQELSSCGAQS